MTDTSDIAMAFRAFVPPPPFWRRVTHTSSSTLRNTNTNTNTILACLNENSPMTSVARLRAMQEAILRRRAQLQTRDTSSTADPNDPLKGNFHQLLNSDLDELRAAHVPTTTTHETTAEQIPENSTENLNQTSPTSLSSATTHEPLTPNAPLPQISEKNINDESDNNSPRTPGEQPTSTARIISRFDGRLPRHNVTLNHTTPIEQVQLPLMTDVLARPHLHRHDFELPRTNVANYSQFNSDLSTSQTTSPSQFVLSHDPDCTSILDQLNDEQREAVLADPHRASIVLAGPGSGKTRVLTHRIAYLLQKHKVPPQSILAVTFTNKAAFEMRSRVASLLKANTPPGSTFGLSSQLTLCTFHSLCLRLLREFGEEISIPSDFQVCDTSDSRALLSRLRRETGRNTDDHPSEDRYRMAISKVKNGLLEHEKGRMFQPSYTEVQAFREVYDQALRAMKCLDFDDLLLETRNLLKVAPSVLSLLQDRYQYILVDEWQDTNQVQFDVVALLSSKRRNLFVVGDADQSIYKFRGANSGNLESFSEAFDGANRFILAHNYRSTACIVKAAQAVISQDMNRPPKEMKTTNRFGARVKIQEKANDKDEARYVVKAIRTLLDENRIGSLSDCAIMFRKNSQSRPVEEACIKCDITYRLLSGTRFYDRKEVKDVLGYLRLLKNAEDNLSFERVINTPPRGIGKKTTEVIERYASQHTLSMLDAIDKLVANVNSGAQSLEEAGISPRQWRGITSFHAIMNDLRSFASPLLVKMEVDMEDENESEQDDEMDGDDTGDEDNRQTIGSLILKIMTKTGYREYLEKSNNDSDFADASGKSSKALERLDNLKELVAGASRHHNIHHFLDHVTLMNDRDEAEKSGQGAVSLMTLHGGKGLEFEAVFIVGVESGIIPMRHNESDEEEERRLLYVGMTRAKQFLTMTWRQNVFRATGKKETKKGYPSPFLKRLPANLVKRSPMRDI